MKRQVHFIFQAHIFFMYQISQQLGQHTKSSLQKLDRDIKGGQISLKKKKDKFIKVDKKKKKLRRQIN